MGTILRAVCKKCGYSKTVYFGGGMLDFTEVCNAPAINKETGKFEVKNILDKEILKKYTFYNEAGMFKSPNINSVHQWGEILLNEKNNLCPECSDFTLDFEAEGFFD